MRTALAFSLLLLCTLSWFLSLRTTTPSPGPAEGRSSASRSTPPKTVEPNFRDPVLRNPGAGYKHSAPGTILALTLDSDKEPLRLALESQLSQLDASDFPALGSALARVPRELQPDLTWGPFLRAWAQLDGEAAFRFALETATAVRQAVAAMEGWAAVDPLGPVAFLESVSDPDERAFLTRYYVAAHLKGDGSAALDLVPELADPVMREAAWRWIAEFSVLTGSTARREAALDSMSNHVHDPSVAEAAGHLVGEWALLDPAAAIQWALALPPGAVRHTVLRDLVGNWGGADPFSCADWLDHESYNPEWEIAVASFALMLASESPEVAREWAQTIHDETLRAGVLHRLSMTD